MRRKRNSYIKRERKAEEEKEEEKLRERESVINGTEHLNL